MHLLYCWTCVIPFGVFSYRIRREGAVEIVGTPKPPAFVQPFGAAGPYEGYVGEFPARRVSLAPLQDALNFEDPIHQVGGQPMIYNPDLMQCPECAEPMPLLAALCNDTTGHDPFGVKEKDSFAGNGSVQMIFHLCRSCCIVSAYHSCG